MALLGLPHLVLLALPLVAHAQIDGAAQASQQSTSQNSARVSVEGVVRNAATGEPLARALVQIEGDADTGTLTNGEGHFEIPRVPVGPQTFRVVKPGFRDRPYATEEAGLQAEGPAHSVLVDTQMPELTFSLAPNCAIRGHIDLSTGDPADGINVVLVKRVVRSGRGIWTQVSTTRANGDGNYRFGGLPDGEYAVYTMPALESEPAVSVVAAGSGARVVRSGFPSVFYPDAREFGGASHLRLSSGSQADANFNLPLEPFYPVSATDAAQAEAAKAGRGAMQGGYTAVITDGAGRMLPYTAQYDDATHSLQANLPDGIYTMVVRGSANPRLFGGAFNGLVTLPSIGDQGRNGTLAGSVGFTVAGHAVNGLRFSLAPPQAAAVHLRLLHNPDNPPTAALNSASAMDLVYLSLNPADGLPQIGGENLWSMDNGPDSLTFTAQPGPYWLSVNTQRKGLCAGAFSAGSFNLAREPLALSLATPPPPMELTLTDDCGTLALTLPSTLAGFLPGEEPFYTVYVVPDFDTAQDLPPMTMHPSSGATLTLDSLTPGSYHVYAFDSPLHLEYRNPAALGALSNAGQQVTVAVGATSSLVLEAPEH